MRYLISSLLIALLASSFMATAEPLYKWVDDQGNVHYSDRPQPGAQKLQLPKAQTYSPAHPAAPVPSGPAADEQRPVSGHTSIAIASPTDQQTLWNTDTVTVGVDLSPSLQPGDQVTITLDGQSQTVAGTSATFNNVERGAHTVTASVSGSGGSVSAKAITFYIQRGTKKH